MFKLKTILFFTYILLSVTFISSLKYKNSKFLLKKGDNLTASSTTTLGASAGISIEELTRNTNQQIAVLEQQIREVENRFQEYKRRIPTPFDIAQVEISKNNQINYLKNQINGLRANLQAALDSQAKVSSEQTVNTNLASSFLQVDVLTGNSRESSAAYTSACLRGFYANLPPSYCKKSFDSGYSPTNCPSGYDRSGTDCIEQCSGNFERSGTTCNTVCTGGFNKSIWNTCERWRGLSVESYPITSYNAKVISNSDSSITCSSGYYKSGSLCYRDCGIIGLRNCSDTECGSTVESCNNRTSLLSTKTNEDISYFVKSQMTFGVKNDNVHIIDIGAHFKNTAKWQLNSASIVFPIISGNPYDVKTKLRTNTYNVAYNAIKEYGIIPNTNVLNTICNATVDKVLGAIYSGTPTEYSIKTFEENNVLESISLCDCTVTESEVTACAKSVLESFDNKDLNVVSALVSSAVIASCPNF